MHFNMPVGKGYARSTVMEIAGEVDPLVDRRGIKLAIVHAVRMLI